MAIAETVWRWFAAIPGQRYVESLLDAGLPGVLSQPLRFLVDPAGRTLTAHDRSVIARVESLRAQLAAQTERYYVAALPANSSAPARIITPASETLPAGAVARSSRWIAHSASVSEYWGTFLYRLAAAVGARSILELGSCAGISACYLASAPNCMRLVTIDGSAVMARLATDNLAKVTANSGSTGCLSQGVHPIVINALFDDGLDQVLPGFSSGIDVAHIDGHHDKEPTLRYFNRIVPHLNQGSVIIFDDIHLYPEMWEAWVILRGSPGFACAVNTGRYGVCLWDGTTERPLSVDMSLFTGRWVVGKPRQRVFLTRTAGVRIRRIARSTDK